MKHQHIQEANEWSSKEKKLLMKTKSSKFFFRLFFAMNWWRRKRRASWRAKECVKGNKMCLGSFIFACRNIFVFYLLHYIFLTFHEIMLFMNLVNDELSAALTFIGNWRSNTNSIKISVNFSTIAFLTLSHATSELTKSLNRHLKSPKWTKKSYTTLKQSHSIVLRIQRWIACLTTPRIPWTFFYTVRLWHFWGSIPNAHIIDLECVERIFFVWPLFRSPLSSQSFQLLLFRYIIYL